MDTPPDTYSGLFLGYAVIWGLIVLFCLILGVRQRDIGKRLAVLEGENKNEQ